MDRLVEKFKTLRLVTLATTVQMDRFARAYQGKPRYEF